MFKVRLPGGLHALMLADGTTLVADVKGVAEVADHLVEDARRRGCALLEQAREAVEGLLDTTGAPAPAPDAAAPTVRGQRAAKEVSSGPDDPDAGSGDGPGPAKG